jgi:hypothetical protein
MDALVDGHRMSREPAQNPEKNRYREQDGQVQGRATRRAVG